MKKIHKFIPYYLDNILVAKGIKKIGDNEISLSILKRKKLASTIETNKYIYNSIASGRPFLVGRFGANELSMAKTLEFGIKSKYRICTEKLSINAGFFPNDIKMVQDFLPLMKEFSEECDVLGTWNQPFEGYFINEYMKPDTLLTTLTRLEPWICPTEPWTAALEGKKVLVIHPFVETIKEQYKKRELIFPNTSILPKFDLLTLKAVQTAGDSIDNRFASWYEALDWMYQETKKLDFDVAIIGCGAYGAPLAAKIKKSDKQAIHLGGATQILFGIMGKRWDGSLNSYYNYVRDLLNDSWVRPSEKDMIQGAEKVENSCYW